MATKKKSAPPASSSGLTVEQFCQYIAGSDWANEDFLHWPPDVFALVGALLLKSGAYAHAISGWTRSGKLEDWVSSIKDNGRAWAKDVEHPPKEIGSWFDVLKANSPLSIDMVCAVPDFCNALLQLSAAADEACVGVVVRFQIRSQSRTSFANRHRSDWFRRTSSTTSPLYASECIIQRSGCCQNSIRRKAA